MQVQVSEIIDRARMFAQDDMNDNKGAILKPERWLQEFGSVYKTFYKRSLMAGLITPPPIDREFTGPEVRLGGYLDLPIGNGEVTPGIIAVQGVSRATISGYRGAVVDLSQWLDGCPKVILQFKTTTARPTFVLADGAAAFGRTGSAFTLTFLAGVTTLSEILTVIAANADVEIVYITPGYNTLVLDDKLVPTTQTVRGGEVLLSEYYTLASAQRRTRDRKPFGLDVNARGSSWTAVMEYSTVRITLKPSDASSQQYVVRYYEMPRKVTSKLEYVTVPDNADELLAMELAEIAMMTEGGASKTLKDRMLDAKAELAFTAASLQQPRLKSKGSPLDTLYGWPVSPSDWIWF